MTATSVAYWLVPEKGDRRALAALIRRLADAGRSPVFEPHVTVYSGPGSREEAAALVARLAGRFRPVRLRVEGIGTAAEYTRTLFLRLGPADRLSRMEAALRRGSESDSPYRLDPHLSLLYRKMDEQARRELVRRVESPLPVVAFDTLRAILLPGPVRSRRDVEAWTRIASAPLGG